MYEQLVKVCPATDEYKVNTTRVWCGFKWSKPLKECCTMLMNLLDTYVMGRKTMLLHRKLRIYLNCSIGDDLYRSGISCTVVVQGRDVS